MPPLPGTPRRRGRPPKAPPTTEVEAADVVAGAPVAAITPVAAAKTRAKGAGDRRPASRVDALTIEALVAVEPSREYRLSPRDRQVAFTADVAGARQLMVMSLRGETPTQVTASEKSVSDPRWSPDGRRLAFVRDHAIWVIELDGSRLARVTDHPAGDSAPRWSPDGRRLAFLSRRRGWAQVWVVDAPVPRRGRPRRDPRPPEPRALTGPGVDVEHFAWSPDGARIATMSQRTDDLQAAQVVIVDSATGDALQIAAASAWETAASWIDDTSLLLVSDASGWFQVVRVSADGRERTVMTTGEVDHGEPTGSPGYGPVASPDRQRFAHVEMRDGYVDLIVAPLAAATPAKRGPGRPPKRPRQDVAAAAGMAVNPWPGIWRFVDWLPDGSAVLAVGEREGDPADLWLLPVAGATGAPPRPRRITRSLPAVLSPVLGSNVLPGERVAIAARDGLQLAGTLWRPASASGRRGGTRVPAIVYTHGGPTWQAYRVFNPFKQLLVREGFAVLDIDFRGSTGYGRAFRLANYDEWGHADVFDVIDAGRWLRDQPWCDGRLAVWGGSYGGYLVLCALVEEPELWRAGIDLYGDSEIAESYRHGDRIGRMDLERQMGRPDDPSKAELYRRGSPVYRAERIQAPLLIFHGRKDKRVVPLMSERMVEALEIEGKHHEVVWYDEEGHGWAKRDTRRDANTRMLAFLKRHLIDDRPPDR